MDQKIRIAFFADVLQRHFDGVSNTIHQLADNMPDHVEVIFIVALPPKEEDNFKHPVYQLPYFAFPFNKEYRVGLPGRMKELPKILEDFQPHVIHYTSPSFMGRYAIRYGRQHNLPVTCIYHTHYQSYMEYYFGAFKPLEWLMSRLARRLSQWFYKKPIRTFVPSQPMKEYLLEIGVKEEQIAFFRRGINQNHYGPQFRDESIRKKWHVTDKKTVLFVSRLVNEKELNTLRRIHDLLAAEREDVQMIVTGDGPFRASLERKMKNAVFTGKQTKADLAALYASSDVFVFPSITETFGNVVLEAMASGLPAVVAAAGGPKGIVEEGKAGFAVEPKNERAFVDKLLEIIDNPQLRSAFALNGIAYARRQQWEVICQEYYGEVVKLVEERQASAEKS